MKWVLEAGYTKNQILAQIYLILYAALDTTAATLTSFIYNLGLNQQLQEQLHREVKSADLEQLEALPLLQKIYQEGLRYFSACYLIDMKAKNDIKVTIEPMDKIEETHSIFFQRGETIYLSPMLAARNPIIFSNPNQFDPYRFNDKIKDGLLWSPFGGGPQACLGREFAKAVLKITIVELVQQYKITSIDSGHDVVGHVTLKYAHEKKATFQKRSS